MVATAMNEMAASSHEVANNDSSTADAAGNANTEAQEGKAVVNKTMDMIKLESLRVVRINRPRKLMK